MRTEYLYEFKVLAETGNFQIAADKLFLSQSALSKHIMFMEDELGFTLIEHKKNKFALTPAGVDFLPYAQNMCDLWNDFTKSSMGRSKTSILDIGICSLSDIENKMFSDAVMKFSKEYTNCIIRTSHINSNDNIEKLLLMDDGNSPYSCLIFKRLSSDNPGFSSSFISGQTLYRTPISILTRKDHPLASKSFKLDELGRYSLISYSYYTFGNELTRRVFRDSKVRAFFVHTVTSMESILDFIREGNYIYLVTEPLDMEHLPDDLTLTPLAPEIHVETFVAYTQDFEQQYEKVFLDNLTGAFSDDSVIIR